MTREDQVRADWLLMSGLDAATVERMMRVAVCSPDTHVRVMSALRCSEALDVLKAVDLKKVTIPLEQIAFARDQYSGIAEYTLSNGWEVGVFNDCDEWDYLEYVRAPDGWSVEYNDMPEWLRDWQPESITADDIWGIGP